MDKTLSVSLMIAFLLIGAVGGAILAPGNDVEVEVPGPTEVVYQNVSVEKLVEVPAPDMLSLAVDAFLQAVEEDDGIDVLGRYNFDEMEVNRIYDDYNVSYQDEITTVDFKIRLRFDEDGEASEKKTFDVTVIYEDGEDTEVIVAWEMHKIIAF